MLGSVLQDPAQVLDSLSCIRFDLAWSVACYLGSRPHESVHPDAAVTIIHSTRHLALAIGAATALLCGSGQAAIVLQNGSFEATSGALAAGLASASGWTNQSGLAIQASSAPAGFESTVVGAVTGSRYLRLASDNPDPINTGFIVQNMGTMVAGESYAITGDLLGASGVGLQFSVLARLSSSGDINPATVYDEQTTAALPALGVAVGGLSLSYTATAADDGDALFLWLRATPSAFGQAVRGGIDNLVLTTTAAPQNPVPEPGSLGLLGAALAGLWLQRRGRARPQGRAA